MRGAGLAAGFVVLAIVLLGTQWDGVEVSPGVWRDRVSLARWAVFDGVLFVIGAAACRSVPRWTARAAVLLPVLLWLAWQLRAGTLWPLALAIYGTAVVVSWFAGCLVADRRQPVRPR